MHICQLCQKNQAIKHSHVIPAFICKAIKKDSLTGYLRQDKTPNKREQDSDKHPILCMNCEQIFSQYEKSFNDYMFQAFRSLNQYEFKYSSWLHYFITSVTWRTLIMDLESNSIPEYVFSKFIHIENIMRKYLLGEGNLSSLINNHVIFITDGGKSENFDLAAAIPIIRQSTGGYTLWKDSKFSSIIVNLAGLLCVTHVELDERDTWYNTKVYSDDGRLESPQKVSSWVAADFFMRTIECNNNMNKLSEKQLEIIRNSVRP